MNAENVISKELKNSKMSTYNGTLIKEVTLPCIKSIMLTKKQNALLRFSNLSNLKLDTSKTDANDLNLLAPVSVVFVLPQTVQA